MHVDAVAWFVGPRIDLSPVGPLSQGGLDVPIGVERNHPATDGASLLSKLCWVVRILPAPWSDGFSERVRDLAFSLVTFEISI